MKSFFSVFVLVFIFLLNTQTSFAAPSISNITDNRSSYPSNQIPKYEKFESTFDVNGILAQNLQVPYDTSPPAGITPNIGISVDAEFTSPSGKKFSQPGFYYTVYDDREIQNNSAYFYPISNNWKIRFSPNETGTWQYKLIVQDAGGAVEIVPANNSFTVVANTDTATNTAKGFIKVAKNDPRYFEYDDGTYFPGLGYNMNYNHVAWANPILDNQSNFQKMKENGIQFVRIWLSQWAIFSSAWNQWNNSRNDYNNYVPRSNISAFQADASAPIIWTWQISQSNSWFSPCLMVSLTMPRPNLKTNTNYRVRAKVRTYNITGPRITSSPNYGFVIKMGGWEEWRCQDPGQSTPISAYYHDNSDFTDIEVVWNSGSNTTLGPLYLALENVNTGSAFIESTGVEEILSGGGYGQNLLDKPNADMNLNMSDRNAYAFDKMLDLAKQNNIYLKPVIMEKNEDEQNLIDYNGQITVNFSNQNFYGNWWTVTRVRWYQQAWWRYLQARWGYSTNIHSWELVNEGDPWNGNHYAQTDSLGKYMHCTVFGQSLINETNPDPQSQFTSRQRCDYQHPNSHMVTTSNWHSYPKNQFWDNRNSLNEGWQYPDVDFSDVHQYIFKNTDANYFDEAANTNTISQAYGAKRTGGAGKPVIRGETGFVNTDSTDAVDPDMQRDTNGIWLHNYIWGQINSGGLIESYWYENYHIYFSSIDHRSKFKSYYDFIKDVPLNNGNYIDVAVTATDTNVRVYGQKDIVNNRAHFWVQNKKHVWCAVVGGISGCPTTWDASRLNGTVTFSGFAPSTQYQAEYWQFDNVVALNKTTATITSDGTGNIIVNLATLSATVTDTGVKIGDYAVVTPTPVPSPTVQPSPTPSYTIPELKTLLSNWLTSLDTNYFSPDGKINALDASWIIKYLE